MGRNCGVLARNRRFAQACSDRLGDRRPVRSGWNDIGAESSRLGGCATHVQPGWNRDSCHGPSLPIERVFRRPLEGQFCIPLGLEVKFRRKLRLEGSSADCSRVTCYLHLGKTNLRFTARRRERFALGQKPTKRTLFCFATPCPMRGCHCDVGCHGRSDGSPKWKRHRQQLSISALTGHTHGPQWKARAARLRNSRPVLLRLV
jgi:hypothetical protein